MSDTIQDELRDYAKGALSGSARDMLQQAADHIDVIEGALSVAEYRVSAMSRVKAEEMTHDERLSGLEEAVSDLQENPASEWLTLPWGGAVRKLEVVSAHVEPAGTLVVVNVRGGIVFSSGSHVFSLDKHVTASSWLADIESQLGIQR